MRGGVAILQRKGGFWEAERFYWGFLRGAGEKTGDGKIDKAAGESLWELAREGGPAGPAAAGGRRGAAAGRPPSPGEARAALRALCCGLQGTAKGRPGGRPLLWDLVFLNEALHQNDNDKHREDIAEIGAQPAGKLGPGAGIGFLQVVVEAPAPAADAEQQINDGTDG